VRRHMGAGSILHPLGQPCARFCTLWECSSRPGGPSYVGWKTVVPPRFPWTNRGGLGPVCRGGRPHEGLGPLALMGTIGAMIEFVVYLPGIFAAETKRAPNLLECRPMSYHEVKACERIRTMFLLKLPLKFIRRLDVEFIAPVGHCRRAHVQ
jgi:hypothetical protein